MISVVISTGILFGVIALSLMSGTSHGVPSLLLGAHRHMHTSYVVKSLWVPVKVNGKAIWAMLDTGSWMSSITGSDVHKLGLDKLPPSKMASNETSVDANGDNITNRAVDITLWVNGQSFKTTVTIDPRTTVGESILSLHDLFQAKDNHRIESKLCHTIKFDNVTNVTWSGCRSGIII